MKTKLNLNLNTRTLLKVTVLILALITISTTTAVAISCNCGDICVNETGWWHDGDVFNPSATPIQTAVDSAIAGETICVAAGSYSENVNVNKQITLEGEGAGVVTVTAANSDDHVFEVTADYVNISGFTATGTIFLGGIYLNGADHCNISENTASNNGIGIYLHVSSCNTLTSNTASNNGNGIHLGSSSSNTLTSNTASGNNGVGIYLRVSSCNTLTSNTASNNNGYGIYLGSSSSNTLTSNTASNNGVGGIYLYESSSDNTLTSNTASNNYNYGIHLGYMCCYNTLTSNTASGNNDVGIGLYSSSDNTLTSNTVNDNNNGIYLSPSCNNNLIYNNYFDNTNNAYDNGNNLWNTEKTSGTNIISGSYLGGNYWSDYAGVDNDGDDLGNTMLPYKSSGDIHNGGDYYPLVEASSDTTPPVITITTPTPYGLYAVGMTLDFSATDSESGVATIVGTLRNTNGVSQIVENGFEPEVGVYDLVVTATDNVGNTKVSDPVFFVVYDPDGGHATGGGWFYPDSDSTLPDGKANFGFTARYKDDESTGKLNFQYKDADIHLKSTSIDWLTISSVSAQFQGTGTINGEGLYTFRVQAKDNGEPGAGSDHFDIKIWTGTDTEAHPYHKAKNTISGGNIEVHKKG